MANETVTELTGVICSAIDVYRLAVKPALTVGEILASIEYIRHGLTERVLQNQKAN